MEEKERYGITDAHYLCDSAIFDTETDEILRLYQICDLLNQQDKENQQLKQQVKQLKQEVEKEYGDGFVWEGKARDGWDEIEKLKQQLKELVAINKIIYSEKESAEKILRISTNEQTIEILKLKQQLHDLPKKIVEEIKTEVEKEKSDNDLAWLGFKKLNRILDTILKKYGGEE